MTTPIAEWVQKASWLAQTMRVKYDIPFPITLHAGPSAFYVGFPYPNAEFNGIPVFTVGRPANDNVGDAA